MTIFAILRYARISYQKSILVANQIRGLPVNDALNILTFSVKKSSYIIKKLLLSALSNAKYKHKFTIEELKISKGVWGFKIEKKIIIPLSGNICFQI